MYISISYYILNRIGSVVPWVR